MTLDDALAICPVVAILRGVSPHEAIVQCEALYAAGIRAVEVPLNSPEPLRSIGEMATVFGAVMAVGAGTVLTREDVDAVAREGGRMIVAPNVSPQVIARARHLGLDPAPGFATASEGFAALAAGARHLKLFPAATYGPGHLHQLKAVLPTTAVIWAVGGVGPGDLAAWWAAGARAFGIGGEIFRPGQPALETGERARSIMTAVRALP